EVERLQHGFPGRALVAPEDAPAQPLLGERRRERRRRAPRRALVVERQEVARVVENDWAPTARPDDRERCALVETRHRDLPRRERIGADAEDRERRPTGVNRALSRIERRAVPREIIECAWRGLRERGRVVAERS